MRAVPLRLLDLLVVAIVGLGAAFAAPFAALWARRGRGGRGEGRHIVVLDGSYTLDAMRRTGQIEVITARDLDGYFDHVWTVHPLVGAAPGPAGARDGGRPQEHSVGSRHTVIEGYTSLHARLRRLPASNFALAQMLLLFRLWRVMRSNPVGAVQAGEPYYQGAMALVLSRLFGVRLAVRVAANFDEIHAATGRPAYPRLLRSRRLEKVLERCVLKRADLVLAANHNNLAFAKDNGARDDRCVVISYGSVLNSVHLGEPGERDGERVVRMVGDRPFAVLVSRLEPVKHPEDCLAALARARRRHPALALLIVGDGSLRDALCEQAEVLGVADGVVLAGSCDQAFIAAALSRGVATLSPITGRALLEAALAARPIVAYDTEWQSEMVIEGETGLLVPYRDADAMGDALAQLIDQPEFAAAMGRAARAHALATMHPDKVRDLQRAAYDRLFRAF